MALDVLHDEVIDAVLAPRVVKGADVRMIQLRDDPGFALQARTPALIACERLGQNLDGDDALEARVARFEHFAHPAGADRRNDLVRTEAGTGGDGHDGERIVRANCKSATYVDPAITSKSIIIKRDHIEQPRSAASSFLRS